MFVTIVISLQKSFIIDLYKLFYDESKSISKMIGMCKYNIKYFENNEVEMKIKLRELKILLDKNEKEISNLKKHEG